MSRCGSQTEQGFTTLKLDGRADPIVVNKYVVQKGESTSLVIYWYQSRDRVVASEYDLRFELLVDTLRLRPRDLLLVRMASSGGRPPDELVRALLGSLRPV